MKARLAKRNKAGMQRIYFHDCVDVEITARPIATATRLAWKIEYWTDELAAAHKRLANATPQTAPLTGAYIAECEAKLAELNGGAI